MPKTPAQPPGVKKNHTLPALAGQIAKWSDACAAVNMDKSDWTRRALAASVAGRLKVRFTEAKLVQGQIEGRGERDEVAGKWQFRATDADVQTWSAAADAQGLKRAEWCRQVLDAAAKRADQSFLLG